MIQGIYFGAKRVENLLLEHLKAPRNELREPLAARTDGVDGDGGRSESGAGLS